MEIPLQTQGGLVTSMRPADLPDGASPRTWDTDFVTGAVTQRPGQQNVYTYEGISLGPDPAGNAVDTPLIGGVKWAAPANVLANDSLYATADLIASASVASGASATVSQATNAAQWVNPQNLVSPTVATTVTLAATPPVTAHTTMSGAGSVSQGASGAQWSTPQYLTANPNSTSVTLGGTSSSGTQVTYQGQPSSATAQATGNYGSPQQLKTQTCTFAGGSVSGNLTLSFNANASFLGSGGGTVQVLVSKDSGASFPTSVFSASSSTNGYIPVSVTISGLTDISMLQVQLYVLAEAGGSGSINVEGDISSLQAVFVHGNLELPTQSSTLMAAALGLSMPADAAYTGISLTIKGLASGSVATVLLQLMAQGALIGNQQTITPTSGAATPFTFASFGFASLTSAQVASLGVQLSASVGGSAPTTLVALLGLSVTVSYSTGGTEQTASAVLSVANLGLMLPASKAYSGVSVAFKGVAVGGTTAVTAQLTVSGNPIGTARAVTLTNGGTLYTVSNLYTQTLTATEIATLGLRISAAVSPGAPQASVSLNDLAVSLQYTGTAFSDGLDVTQFGFYAPSGVPIGFRLALTGSAPASATVTLTMLRAGIPVGTPATVALTPAVTTVAIGGMSDLFNAAWSASDINNIDFGVRIQAVGAGVVSIGYITMELYLTAISADFNFIQTFKAENGGNYNLALDASGNWWLEDITNMPSQLQLVLAGTTAGSYGSGTTVYDRAFVANSILSGNLVTGSDIPRQYNFEGKWWDRITQVGPGAPPSFTASQASGAVAAITSVSITSNIATVTANNSYTAGEVGTFSGLTGAGISGMNGQTLVVLSTGLSGTQFEVAYSNANVGATGQSGASFTPQYVYPISTITQPPAYSDPSDPGHLSVLLWSAGPGSTSSGDIITVYYQSSFNYPTPDETLVGAFNGGSPVYVYITGAPFGNGIWQVTSIGNALPPGVDHWRYYFTIQVPTVSYQTQIEPGGQYEITQATVTTATPVPGLAAGAQVSIAGASVAAWDGVYPVVQALQSGAYNVTQTALAGGVATYTWSLASGTAPVSGQLVTITNTLNANGILNVTDAVISAATGTTSGTFTINGFQSSLTYPTTVEQGQATTAGSQFIIDPGASNAGSTGTNPILGNSTGGSLSVVGAASSGTLPIGAGTRQGVVIFVTRNGAYGPASPPITFTVAEGANYISASNVPIGPPNVLYRLIALTEAGQLGVAGSNFYTTTVPTIFTVGGVEYTSSSFLISDNQTTNIKLTFSDAVLLNGDAIDIEGNNLFNLIEIGNPAWIVQYADRTFYGGCQDKVQNFNNLSFDGGYLQPNGGPPLPLGWTIDPSSVVPYGTAGTSFSVQLRTSPIFGNSYYIFNGTGAVAAGQQGLAVQSAYQDAYNEPILAINTPYSVRVTCRAPSGLTGGNLIIELNPAGESIGYTGGTFQYYGLSTIPLASMTTAFKTFTLPLTTGIASIPASLQLQVWSEFLAAGGDVEIDRIEVFPTNAPVLKTKVLVSYEEEPEQVDGVTGQITLASQSQDQVYGAIIIHDTLHFLKENSIIECEDAANLEPSQWTTRAVSQRVGTCGPNAFDYGDEWALTLHQTGIYAYNGGVPMPISRELQGFSTGDAFWDQINWQYAQNFWLANDLRARRFYVGVAMTTPNFWLPLAPVADPSQPNVVLMCNYEGVPGYSELEEGAPIHVTMFGSTKALDMRRKWSVWQIVSPFSATVLDGAQSFDTLLMGNGRSTGKIYRLIAPDQQMTDDGQIIAPLYTTYGMPGMLEGQQKQIGAGEKLATYFTANIEGAGSMQLRWYPNTLSATYPQANPLNVALQYPAQNNIERRMEVRGQRIFTEFSMNQGPVKAPGYFELSEMKLEMIAHPWGTRRGVSS